MAREFDSLDPTEPAGIGAELNRCRVLAAKIANELRKKRPEHVVDTLSLEDIHACLEHAAAVLSTMKDFADAGSSAPPIIEGDLHHNASDTAISDQLD